MKTIKVMSIIGLSLVGLYLIVFFGYNDYDWAEVTAGWGMITTLYLIALSIVGIVQAKRNK